jgi:NADH:ubiquinone oxidoreductase subunit E
MDMATDAQIKAQAKYDAENTRQVHLKLNRNTDKDVLEKLDEVQSKQGYIKRLIREDLAKEG